MTTFPAMKCPFVHDGLSISEVVGIYPWCKEEANFWDAVLHHYTMIFVWHRFFNGNPARS